MNKIELLREIANKTGSSFRDDYSGRGMYGKTCVAICCDDPNEVIAAVGEAGIRGALVDEMGRRSVLYWPSISTKEEESKNESI